MNLLMKSLIALSAVHISFGFNPIKNFKFGRNFIEKNAIQTKLYESLLDTFFSRFKPSNIQKDEEETTESDLLIDFVDYKPWRAPKVKNLKYVYRPTSEGYLERFRNESDDCAYFYSTPQQRFIWDYTKPVDAWIFPWLWSNSKTERFSWMYKYYMEDVERVSVQEFMEMDAMFSEFDMAYRWASLRYRELFTLNLITFYIMAYTDYNGEKPTDLGMRPDGSLRTCPVQFHQCISTSNDPMDTEHHVPTFKWSIEKSPEQAFEEIKNVYLNYPKRGLKWTNGWIDRGSYTPEQFSGNYFRAKTEELAFRFSDDVELKIDPNKREVQFRSASRIGQSDWDTNRLRYNQFVRMLKIKGGWEETEFLPKINWFYSSPLRWTQKTLDSSIQKSEKTLDFLFSSINSPNEGELEGKVEKGAARRVFNDFNAKLKPFVDPLLIEEKKLESFLNDNIQNNEQFLEFKNNFLGFERDLEEKVGSLGKITKWDDLYETLKQMLPEPKEIIEKVVEPTWENKELSEEKEVFNPEERINPINENKQILEKSNNNRIDKNTLLRDYLQKPKNMENEKNKKQKENLSLNENQQAQLDLEYFVEENVKKQNTVNVLTPIE